MSNQLIIPANYHITTEVGSVEFVGFEDMKAGVQRLADRIKTVEVTEENVQESKRLVAEVNKAMANVNDERKMAKAQLLEPYQNLENQIKELETILAEPVGIVREQLRHLEELERQEKANKIEDLFNKRVDGFGIGDIVSFDDFFKPAMANKSTTLKSIESDMVDFMNGVKADRSVIETLPNSGAVMAEYLHSFNLASAMNKVKQREESEARMKQLEAERAERKRVKPEPVKTEPVAHFIITGEKDIQLVELLLEKASIKFERENV